MIASRFMRHLIQMARMETLVHLAPIAAQALRALSMVALKEFVCEEGSLNINIQLQPFFEYSLIRDSILVIKKIISGGQTGVDRAALDWAISHGIAHGGWCSQGRLAEDGVLDNQYQLVEIEHGSYRQRTKRNVLDSDGTLILNMGDLDGGTLATFKFAQQLNKPIYVVQVDDNVESEAETVMLWLQVNNIATLNVAGPRESKRPNVMR
ncbi:MAG: putative molybdenum carrier protein [Methylotenera sp.]